ncbi:MAG: CoA-binding protein [bacterium]
MIPAEEFYTHQPIAIFGVSARSGNFGTSVYLELQKVGVRVFPINPKGGALRHEPIFPTLRDLPEMPQAAVILTKGDGALHAVEACAEQGVKRIWLQGGSDTPTVRQRCADLGLNIVYGSCVLLRKGRFPHNIHRFFYNLFSRKD